MESKVEWCCSGRGIVLDGQWITADDGSWRNDVESTRDGDEEGEGKEHNGLHDEREEGAVGRKRGIQEYLCETGVKEGARFPPITGEMTETPL